MANEITGLRQPSLQPAQARPVANGQVGAQPARGNEPGTADTVTLTDSARLMQRLEAAVANAQPVDQKRIDQLKQQIASGAYHVDLHKVAQQVASFEDALPPSARNVEIDKARTDNGYTWNVTWTTPRGTFERDVTVARDAETGTVTRDIVWTGPEGQHVSRHGQAQLTENGYVTQGTLTGRNGETVSRSVETIRDLENHTVTRVTTVDGREHDVTITTQFSRNSAGEIVHESHIEPVDQNIT